ncbi:amidohydrolase family protein [Vulgatibacter sp.]|uniref:amidohydrolase family protein n=1 Tax=Vulgatibacter sp. TaxID=1971226 RepID=UPI00356254D5
MDTLRTMRVIDAHVHAFPPRVFEAIWRWFDRHAWPVQAHYRLQAREVVRHLLDAGVDRVVALHYAHLPGMAAALNRFVADLAAEEPRVVPCATVLPGEPGAGAILDEALGPLRCRGVKIHCHVQCVAPDDPRLDDVYAAAAAHGVPVVIHAGDAPASPAYGCDVQALCTPRALARALARHRRTQLVVPHLGAERMEEVAALLGDHENLHLDTTMALAGFFPVGPGGKAQGDEAQRWLDRALALVRAHPDRILYGTDFPNLPYAWDTELRTLEAAGLEPAALRAILGGNAARLFRID